MRPACLRSASPPMPDDPDGLPRRKDQQQVLPSHMGPSEARSLIAAPFEPVFGGWWGKSFGLGPAEELSSRRPRLPPPPNSDELRDALGTEGSLFEDPDFEASDSNIFFSRRPPHPFQWKRPHEISKDPHFMVGGTTRFDVQQGELGDCWLLAAVANLTLHPKLFARVVPVQSISTNYCGLYKFNFWQYGHWVEIVIDDRLPTYNGGLVFMHSKDRNEFWSALLEKAYAKLHGSYEALKGGSTSEAMEDFTGGLAEMYELGSPPPALFRILEKAAERGSLMACSLEADPAVVEARLGNGLVRGHAYSLTAVRRLNLAEGPAELLRLRNPWGKVEWTGAWADASPEWTRIEPAQRRTLGLSFEADGEFWLSFQDFLANFDKIEICNLGPEAYEAVRAAGSSSPDRPGVVVSWRSAAFSGAWSRGSSAGGCRNFLNTFSSNPQFRIDLADADEEDEDGKCTCIVALLQKHRRSSKGRPAELLTIGFALYKTEPDDGGARLDTAHFRTHVSIARSHSFINLREVCCRFRLPAGAYTVVPSTFEPNEEGEFMLRVFSEKPAHLKTLEDHTSYKKPAPPVKNAETEDRLSSFFTSLAGADTEIDAWELRKILTFALKKEFSFGGFSEETAKGLVALVDVSRSGRLDLPEFRRLWSLVRTWKAAFRTHDKDGSGSIDAFELRDALSAVGYRLHSRVLKALVLRYADARLHISFDSFIACACKLNTLLDIFDERPKQGNSALFDMDAFVELTMYS